jgi:hypothetical protein
MKFTYSAGCDPLELIWDLNGGSDAKLSGSYDIAVGDHLDRVKSYDSMSTLRTVLPLNMKVPNDGLSTPLGTVNN